jgi:hypothetical protein
MPVIPALRSLRQEDHDFKARIALKKKKKEEKEKESAGK